MGETTTIRVSVQTRERLNALAAKRGAPAGEIVAELVEAADDDRLLKETERAFDRLAEDPAALAAYRSETCDLDSELEPPTPDW